MAISTATNPKAMQGKAKPKAKMSAKAKEANRRRTIGSSENDMGPSKKKAPKGYK